MKIKLSRSQWEGIGKKAGWISDWPGKWDSEYRAWYQKHKDFFINRDAKILDIINSLEDMKIFFDDNNLHNMINAVAVVLFPYKDKQQKNLPDGFLGHLLSPIGQKVKTLLGAIRQEEDNTVKEQRKDLFQVNKQEIT